MAADRVALVKFGGDLQQTFAHGLRSIGFHVPSDRPILIKPNLCVETDKTGASTTNAPFIQALIRLLLEEERSAVLRVIESDSTGKKADVAFRNLGYTQLVREFQAQGFDVALINLSQEPLTTVTHPGLFVTDVTLPTVLVEPKVLISVAKAKALIGLTTITGILKNQFGCLPEKNKFQHHHRHLDELIVDLNTVLRPDLGVVDAIVGQEGPEGGRIHSIGVVLFGRSPASVDSVMAQVMGFNPPEIRHLVLAEEQGLGSLTPWTVGAAIEDVAIRFGRHRDVMSIMGAMGRYVPEWVMSAIGKLLG